MNNKTKEYRTAFGIMFRKYRKKYDINELILADDNNQYWNSIAGQPICSIRTVYNIESTNYGVDDSVLEFLLKKMGFRYPDEMQINKLENLAESLLKAISEYDSDSLKKIKLDVKPIIEKKIFLLNEFALMMICVIDFYLDNNSTNFSLLDNERYLDQMFPGIFKEIFYLYKICDNLTEKKNFRLVNQYASKTKKLNDMDIIILMLAQLPYQDTLKNLETIIFNKLNEMDKVFKEHYCFLIMEINSYYINCQRLEYRKENKEKYTLELIKEKDDINIVIGYLKSILKNVGESREYKTVYNYLIKMFE